MRRIMLSCMRHLERGPALRWRRITWGPRNNAALKLPTASSTGC